MSVKKSTDTEALIEAEVEQRLRQSWKELLADPRTWAVIVLSAVMSTSVLKLIEKTTGLELNPSEDKIGKSCVLRALYDGEMTDSERLVSARVCLPLKK